MTIPTIHNVTKSNSIHTLGRGSLDKINLKYPSLKQPTKTCGKLEEEHVGGGDNSNGNTTDNTSLNDNNIAQHVHTANEAIHSMSNIKIGEQVEQVQGASAVLATSSGNNDHTNNKESSNNSSPRKSFNALVSKFGGSVKMQSKNKNEVLVDDPQSFVGESLPRRPTGTESDEADNNESGTTSNNETSPRISSPGISTGMPSFLKSKSSSMKQQSVDQPVVGAPQSMPNNVEEKTSSISNNITLGMKKMSSIKHQLKPTGSGQQQKQLPTQSAQPNPQSAERTNPQSKQLSRNTNRPKKKNTLPPNNNSSWTNNARQPSQPPSKPHIQKLNMVQPKSRQRLILEQIAAQYFLSSEKQHQSKRTNSSSSGRYVGVTDYGDGSNMDGLGNIDECTSRSSSGTPTLGLSSDVKVMTKDRRDIIAFVEGNISRRNSSSNDDGDDRIADDDAKNLSIITEASGCSKTSTGSSQKSKTSDTDDIQRESNIDVILEMASDYLSLGKNDLALTAYRRAMKVAFADVISVKQKLVDVKKRQQSMKGDDMDLTKQQEQQFELSLLQVASRVADVHNNMGVVHEMNRQYEKARASYVDALEVYHNTCKRFEEKGDVDVDRTKKNVERMTLACTSEKERKALHDKALKIAKGVGYKRDVTKQKILLQDAIIILKRALDLEGKTIGLSHPVAASTLIAMGKYHYEMREYDSAVLEIRRAITILRNALGGRHPQVGKSTLLLASIYERHGLDISPKGTEKDDSELELYVDALEPLKATLGEVHSEVAFLYSKIGYLYGKKGDRSLSLLAYKASLKAYGEPSSLVDPEVLSIWVRVTEHLMSLRLYDEAVVAGSRALYLLRKSKNTLFQDAQLTSSISSNGSVGSGGASVTSSQLPTPIPSKTKSSKRSQILITSDTYYESLFTTLQSLGQAHTSLSNYTLARDACSESLQLAWEMALSTSSSNGKKEDLATSILRVVRALKRLGKALLLEKQYPDALECFMPSLELLRSSKEMESSLDCASVLGSLGFLYLKLRRFQESSNFLRECLRLYQKHGELITVCMSVASNSATLVLFYLMISLDLRVFLN